MFYNSNPSYLDIGESCGFEILGSNGKGFIKTSNDASRYIIKAPNNNDTNYITTFDLNNNLNISGNTLIYNSLTVLSNLYIQNNTLFNDNVTINSLLNDANFDFYPKYINSETQQVGGVVVKEINKTGKILVYMKLDATKFDVYNYNYHNHFILFIFLLLLFLLLYYTKRYT
jgi:hypothetical protein